jgi:serine/threonine protein kinase
MLTGKQVALKRILMHNESQGFPITAIREIKLLKRLKHVNVVQLVDIVVELGEQVFVPYIGEMWLTSLKPPRKIRDPFIWFFLTWIMILLVYSRIRTFLYSLVKLSYI